MFAAVWLSELRNSLAIYAQSKAFAVMWKLKTANGGRTVEIKKPAVAGTLESSDVQITLRPNPQNG
jgi:hypothetical protein